jgi:hypothetical protein
VNSLDYSNTPHACFKVEAGASAGINDEFPPLLENHLHALFDPAQKMKKTPLGSWAIELEVGQKSFTMLLDRSKYEDGEWVLLVGPSRTPGLLDLLRGRKPVDYSPELVQVCREIHGALSEIPRITALRWYFEGFHSQTVAVATPDELPWNQPVPGESAKRMS